MIVVDYQLAVNILNTKDINMNSYIYERKKTSTSVIYGLKNKSYDTIQNNLIRSIQALEV